MHIKTAPLIGAALVGFCDRQCRVCAVRCARTSTERSEASSEEEKENENDERPKKKTTITQAPCLLHFFSFILVCAEKKEQPSTNIETGKSIGSGDQQQKRADRWRTLTVERKMKWNSFSRTHKLKLRLKLPRCRYTLELEAALGSRICRASMCVKRASASDSVRACVRLRGEMVKQQTERRKFDERNTPMLANVAFIWTFSFYVYILVFFSLAHFFFRTKLTAALVCCCVFSSGGSFFSSIVECSRGDSISFDDDDDDEMKWKIFYISPRWVDDDDERDEFIGTGCMSKLNLFEVCKCVLNVSFYYSFDRLLDQSRPADALLSWSSRTYSRINANPSQLI